MMQRVNRMMMGLAALATIVLLGACAYLQHPKFGAYPEGKRMQTILRSPRYVEGEFRSAIPTPILTENNSMLSILASTLLNPVENLRPTLSIPVTKTDLKALDQGRDAVIWLGHSSFFVLFSGKRILIDPVFSPFAAPVSFSTKAFDGTNLYTVEDFPEIDLLLITHDHWDHLDYATVTALRGKVRQVLVALGVGAHFEQWGYAHGRVREADWYEKVELDTGLAIHLVPARHYSGRWLTRNKTLWTGFVLESGKRRILFSGDTGYGPHFKELAQRFGGFDLGALDMGQYDPRWPYIHMTPEEAAQAAEEVKAKALLPAHTGRFALARHAWNEPFERIRTASIGKSFRLLTPKIGDPVHLDEDGPQSAQWWDDIERIAAARNARGSQ